METTACIINADDFGRNPEVNSAILRCFREGWISSASIMANMPGFVAACRIVREYDLNDFVGLHFVLSEGVPLTDGIKRFPRFCNEDGIFHATRKKRILFLNAAERVAVREELLAQIARCRESGLKLTHIDSHHHIHEELGIISLIISVMREKDIRSIRIMGNMTNSRKMIRRLYMIIYNNILKLFKINRTHYFGSFEEYEAFASGYFMGRVDLKSFEIMIHPVIGEKDIVVDSISGISIENFIKNNNLYCTIWQPYDNIISN